MQTIDFGLSFLKPLRFCFNGFRMICGIWKHNHLGYHRSVYLRAESCSYLKLSLLFTTWKERPAKVRERDGFILLFLRFTASFNSDFSEIGLDLVQREAGLLFITEWPHTWFFSVVLSRRRWSIFISYISSSGGWYFSGSGLNTSFLLFLEPTELILNL